MFGFHRVLDFEVPLPVTLFKMVNRWDIWQFLHGVLGSTLPGFAKVQRYSHDTLALNVSVTTRLLSEASRILQDRFKSPQTTKMLFQFHLLCLGLVSSFKDREGSKFHYPHVMDKTSNERLAIKYTRRANNGHRWFKNGATTGECEKAKRPIGEECFGMCGPHCWCWYWICGDCCIHRGCYEHDQCCRQSYVSMHCLFPLAFGFSCRDGYHGYPDCLRGWTGHYEAITQGKKNEFCTIAQT